MSQPLYTTKQIIISCLRTSTESHTISRKHLHHGYHYLKINNPPAIQTITNPEWPNHPLKLDPTPSSPIGRTQPHGQQATTDNTPLGRTSKKSEKLTRRWSARCCSSSCSGAERRRRRPSGTRMTPARRARLAARELASRHLSAAAAHAVLSLASASYRCLQARRRCTYFFLFREVSWWCDRGGARDFRRRWEKKATGANSHIASDRTRDVSTYGWCGLLLRVSTRHRWCALLMYCMHCQWGYLDFLSLRIILLSLVRVAFSIL